MIFKVLLWVAIFVSLVFRFFYLQETILGPHVWRQSDTANYIWDFYKNGIDIFHPAVCWMGSHKTVILEFPLIEAIIAFFYHLIGPSHIVAKLVFLAFYLASCFYLYRLVKLFTREAVACLSVIVYVISPLGLFYSIAIHIDFAEMCFVLAMCYYFTKGILDKKISSLLWGSFFTTLSLMTKIPYVVVVLLPMIHIVFKHNKIFFLLKHSYTLIAPLLLYFLWQNHVFAVNDSAPDWPFFIGYRKFTFEQSLHWYFGKLDMRFEFSNWLTILKRIAMEVVGIPALASCFLGLFWVTKKYAFFYLWFLGCLVYVTLFFNLNVVHNYYQIPFVPICAILAALAIEGIYTKLKSNAMPVVALLTIMTSTNFYYASTSYFLIPHSLLDISKRIKELTGEKELLLINYGNTGVFFPNILYGARRNGWMVLSYGLDAATICNFKDEGASKFILIESNVMPEHLQSFLSNIPSQKIELNDQTQMTIFDLETSPCSEEVNPAID